MVAGPVLRALPVVFQGSPGPPPPPPLTGVATIDSITADTDYGSGSNPWCLIERINDTHFLRLYPAGTAFKGRIGVIDTTTGIVTYGSENSLPNVPVASAASTVPCVRVTGSGLAVIHYEIPEGGFNHSFHVRGLSYNTGTGAIVDSSAEDTIDDGTAGQFAGSSLAQTLAAADDGQFLTSFHYKFSGKLINVHSVTETDLDTLTVGSAQDLTGATNVARTAWRMIWIDEARTKGLVLFGDFTDSALWKVRAFSRSSATVTPQDSAVTVLTDYTFSRFAMASFTGLGAVLVGRDPADATRAIIHFLDYNVSSYAVGVDSTATLSMPSGFSVSGFGAETIDESNVLITIIGGDGTDTVLSAWVAHLVSGTYSVTGRTDFSMGVSASSAHDEQTIARCGNDWYVAQTAQRGANSNLKIKLAR